MTHSKLNSCDHKGPHSPMILIASLLLLASFNIAGQISKSDSVIFYSHPTMDSLLKANTSPGRLLGRSKENEAYLVVIRTAPGDVEIHELFDDVAIVRSGHAILRTGFKVTGHKESRTSPSREWLGGIIQDPIERKLSPGDFIVIPAMLPHQYIPIPGEKFTYWTIKVKRTKN